MRTAGSKNRSTPARRREILDGALAVFLEQGVTGATLDAICAKLAVTKGSVYHHFSSKEEIAVHLYKETVDSIHSQVVASLSNAPSAQAGIERLIREYLAWFETNGDRGLFMFRIMDGHLLSEHVGEVRQMQREFVEKAAEWLTPYVKAGQVRKMPARLHISLVVGPSREFLRVWFEERDPTLMRSAQRLLPSAAWRAIAADAGDN